MSYDWPHVARHLYYAYQPIVSINTGETYGFEALVRGWDELGFRGIPDLFDSAYSEGCLPELDVLLRTKAVDTFIKWGHGEYSRLFYNLDGRTLETQTHLGTPDMGFLEDQDPALVCFEITEHQQFGNYAAVVQVINECRRKNYRIALDDFGSGYAGLRLLYHAHPDLVKIDRFFIEGVDIDPLKKIFVSKVVTMAHAMGMLVVAEGVESEFEFRTCREVGCDFVQGYFIQRPSADSSQLKPFYAVVEQCVAQDRRQGSERQNLLTAELSRFEPVQITTPVTEVLKIFRAASDIKSLPVTNAQGEPLGVIREKDLKSYVYSPYGISILMNQSSNNHLHSFVYPVPVVDIHSRIDTVVSLYASHQDSDAVIVTQNGKYYGLLDSRALLRALNEREIAEARDLNPLTKLPGNTVITEFISESLSRHTATQIYAYMDFVEFKPFNDVYGFRLGDRAIVLFAEMLREFAAHHQNEVFVGHIGGDDFFVAASASSETAQTMVDCIYELAQRFKHDARSLYTTRDRERDYIVAADRQGRECRFPLLSVSTGVMVVECGAKRLSLSEFGRRMALIKKESKTSENKISVRSYSPQLTLDCAANWPLRPQ